MKKYTILFLSIGILSMAKAETIVIDVVEGGGNEINYPRITLDSQNRPHIVYHRNYALKYATIRDGIAHTEVIEEDADRYRYSIAVNSSDNPCIAYTMDHAERLIYAFYDGSQWVKDTVDKVGYGDFQTYGIVLRMNGDTPYIVAYSADIPDHHLVMYKKDGDTWIADSLDIKPRHMQGPYLDMVIKDGIPHIFYLRDDTTDHKTGDFRIFTRRWENSWGQEQKVASIDRQYYDIHAKISKDGKTGIGCYSGYGGTGEYHHTYIYYDNNSWNQEYLENEIISQITKVMHYPALTYDTLNIPHIFGEEEDTIWHYYKTESSWEREAIVIKEHLYSDVDCEIDDENTYHLVFHRGGTSQSDTLYYTTSSVSGIEYKDSKEVETITIIRKGESIVLNMNRNVNTELEIVDISGRIRGELIVKNGTGEWKPESKGVYFLTSKNSKIPPVKVVVW